MNIMFSFILVSYPNVNTVWMVKFNDLWNIFNSLIYFDKAINSDFSDLSFSYYDLICNLDISNIMVGSVVLIQVIIVLIIDKYFMARRKKIPVSILLNPKVQKGPMYNEKDNEKLYNDLLRRLIGQRRLDHHLHARDKRHVYDPTFPPHLVLNVELANYLETLPVSLAFFDRKYRPALAPRQIVYKLHPKPNTTLSLGYSRNPVNAAAYLKASGY